jgi:hypothetical protein
MPAASIVRALLPFVSATMRPSSAIQISLTTPSTPFAGS